MCYCQPNVRTPVCPNCATYLYQENMRLKFELDQQDSLIKANTSAMTLIAVEVEKLKEELNEERKKYKELVDYHEHLDPSWL